MSRLNWCSISCISLFTLFRAVSCSSVLGVMIPISTVRHRQISLSVMASISSTIRGRKVFLWVNNVLLFSKILFFQEIKPKSIVASSVSYSHVFPRVDFCRVSLFQNYVIFQITCDTRHMKSPFVFIHIYNQSYAAWND